jgi:hypothetical protein
MHPVYKRVFSGSLIFFYLYYIYQEACLCLLKRFRRGFETTPRINFICTCEVRDFFRFDTGKFLTDFSDRFILHIIVLSVAEVLYNYSEKCFRNC